MASNPKRAKSGVAYIRLCDAYGHTTEQLINPLIKAEESVQMMFKHHKESLMNALRKAEIQLHPSPEINCLDGNIFIEIEPFEKWSEETLRRYRDRVNLELQKHNINNVIIDQVMEKSSLSNPIILESDLTISELELQYQYHLNKCNQDSIPAELQVVGTLLKELKEKVSVAVLSENGIGKSFLLNLLLLLTSESYRSNKKIKLPKDITGNPTIEIVKEEHFEDLPEVIKDFLDDITDDQQDFKSVLEPICNELSFTGEMEQQNTEISFKELSKYFTDHRRASIEPYLLPEKDNCQAYLCTTNCVIHLRHGVSFQAKVEFFNQEELQNQLFELVLLRKETSTDKGKNHRKSLKKRFTILTKCTLEKEKRHKTLELINSPKDIILYDEVKAFAGKTELYVGNGINPTNDRLALQDLLKKFTLLEGKDENSIMRLKLAALKRIVVYVPSNLLYGGKEILEMPGTIESDPLTMSFIQDELDTVDAVIVLSKFAFKLASTEVKDVLKNSDFIKKWMKNPKEYKLMFVSYPEKNQPYQLGRNDIEKLKKIKEEKIIKRNKDIQELEKQLSQVLSEETKKYIFSTTILPVLHCSIHAIEGDPHGVLEENKDFLENTGVYALIRELDQLTLKRKSDIIEEVKNKLAEFEKDNMDRENKNVRMDEEIENPQLDEDYEIIQMDEESEMSKKDDKSQRENDIGSPCKRFKYQNETNFLKKNEDLFEKLKKQNEFLIEKTLNEQLKNTMEKVTEPAKTNLVTIRNANTETRFFNPQYSGRHSCFKVNLYNHLFGHLDEEISQIFQDLIEKMRDYLDEYKENAIRLFTEELRGKKKLRTASVGNSLQCALGWYMGKTRSSFNEENLVKTFKDLLTESMKKHILQPAYTKTTATTRLIEGEVAAQIEIVMLDVQSSFKKHIFSLYNEKWPVNLAMFMVRSYLPGTSIPRPGCTFCGKLKCTLCLYIVHSDTFTSRAKKVYTVKEHFQCTTRNAIYLITCRRCNLQYVGQTSMAVRRRFVDHLSTINCKKDLSVPRHFNLPDHSLQDIKFMVIDKVENSRDLLKREEYWIRELNTLQPNGLNATK